MLVTVSFHWGKENLPYVWQAERKTNLVELKIYKRLASVPL